MDHVSDHYKRVSNLVDCRLCRCTPLQISYANPSAFLPRPLTPPLGFVGSDFAGLGPAGGLPVNRGLAGGLSHLMPPAPESKMIRIGGLARNVDMATLRRHSDVFGAIDKIYLGQERGFAYITYISEDSVERVRETQSPLSCTASTSSRTYF